MESGAMMETKWKPAKDGWQPPLSAISGCLSHGWQRQPGMPAPQVEKTYVVSAEAAPNTALWN